MSATNVINRLIELQIPHEANQCRTPFHLGSRLAFGYEVMHAERHLDVIERNYLIGSEGWLTTSPPEGFSVLITVLQCECTAFPVISVAVLIMVLQRETFIWRCWSIRLNAALSKMSRMQKSARYRRIDGIMCLPSWPVFTASRNLRSRRSICELPPALTTTPELNNRCYKGNWASGGPRDIGMNICMWRVGIWNQLVTWRLRYSAFQHCLVRIEPNLLAFFLFWLTARPWKWKDILSSERSDSRIITWRYNPEYSIVTATIVSNPTPDDLSRHGVWL
jgi:hypothetical protein